MGQETLKKTTGSQDKGRMPEAMTMNEEPLAGPGVALIPDDQNSPQKSRSSMSGSQVA